MDSCFHYRPLRLQSPTFHNLATFIESIGSAASRNGAAHATYRGNGHRSPRPSEEKASAEHRPFAIVAVGVTAAAWAVMRLKPAIPTVDASTIWPDTVKRGHMVVQVRGLGTLVPREDSIQLIPAQTDATVVRIRVLPGTKVTPDTIFMDLTDPQLQQQLLTAQLALKQAEADYKSLQATLQSTLMDKNPPPPPWMPSTARRNSRRRSTSSSTSSASSAACIRAIQEQRRPAHRPAPDQPAAAGCQPEGDQGSARLGANQDRSGPGLLASIRSRKTRSRCAPASPACSASLPTPVSVGEHVTAGTSVAEVIDPAAQGCPADR